MCDDTQTIKEEYAERKNYHLHKTMEEEKRQWGRPQHFTPEQIEKIKQDFKLYIETEEDPTIVWFTSSYPQIYSETLGRETRINKDYISDHEEFSELRKQAIEKQESYLQKWATKNQLNATMAVFRLKQPQHWFRDKTEVDNTINGNMNINLSDASDDELLKIINK